MVLLFCSLYLLNRARKEGGDGQKARSKVYGGRKQVTEVNQDQSFWSDKFHYVTRFDISVYDVILS